MKGLLCGRKKEVKNNDKTTNSNKNTDEIPQPQQEERSQESESDQDRPVQLTFPRIDPNIEVAVFCSINVASAAFESNMSSPISEDAVAVSCEGGAAAAAAGGDEILSKSQTDVGEVAAETAAAGDEILTKSPNHAVKAADAAVAGAEDEIVTGETLTTDVNEAGAAVEEEIVVKYEGCFKDVQTLKWHSLNTSTIFAERVGHALVTCLKSKKIYMLGGGNHEGDIKEIWVLDYANPNNAEEMVWESLDCKDFTGRYEFAAAINPDNDKIWIFGGADFQMPRNDVCYLDIETGEFVSKFSVNKEIAVQTREDDNTSDFGVPFPRTQGGNSCLLQLGERTYMAVYGGGVKGEHAVPDGHLYLYDIESGEWERIVVTGDTPGLRQGHVMTSVGTKIFVHGGMHEFNIFNDLYSIDLQDFRETTPSWFKIKSEVYPTGRAAQGIAKEGKDIYILGGLGDDGTLGDLWKFDTESLQWTELITEQFSAPRLDAALTLINLGEGSADETGGSKKILLVHGGMNTEGTLYSDFWALALP